MQGLRVTSALFDALHALRVRTRTRPFPSCSSQNVAKFAGHAGPITSMSFSENGYYLATSATDGVKLWDLRKLKNFRTLTPYEGVAAGGCAGVDFDRSGLYLAVGGADARVYSVKQDWAVVQTFPDLPQQVRSAFHSQFLLCTRPWSTGPSCRPCPTCRSRCALLSRAVLVLHASMEHWAVLQTLPDLPQQVRSCSCSRRRGCSVLGGRHVVPLAVPPTTCLDSCAASPRAERLRVPLAPALVGWQNPGVISSVTFYPRHAGRPFRQVRRRREGPVCGLCRSQPADVRGSSGGSLMTLLTQNLRRTNKTPLAAKLRLEVDDA